MNRHLGYTAQSKRKLKDGKAYNHFFVRTKPKTDPIINQAATTHDTVGLIKDIVLDTLAQTKKLADHLWAKSGNNLNTFLKNVWQFQYDHIGYELDDDKTEQLREPIRTWEDKKADCDCFSLLTSSILTNRGIEHYFRIVKMQNRSYFQHIYIIVPKPNTTFNPNNSNTYYTIDVVVDSYNYEPPGVTFKSDIKMTIKVQRLNGIGSPTMQNNQPCIHGAEFSGYGSLSGLGLGTTCSDEDKVSALKSDFMNRLKVFFNNSKIAVQKNPNLLPGKATQYVQDVNNLMAVWNDEFQRTKALDTLSNSWSNEADNLEAVRQIGRALNLKEGRIKKVRGNAYLKQRRKFSILPNGVITSPVEGEMSIIPNGANIAVNGIDMGSIFTENLSGYTPEQSITFAGFVEDDNFDLAGLENENEEHFVIEGINGLGKKIKISIKPKNVFKAASNAVKSVQKVAAKVQDKAKNTAIVKGASKLQTKTKVAAKQAAKKIVEVGKKVAKAVVRYSPVGIAARNGLLIWFKLNIGRNSEKLIMAYATKEQAAKAGLSEKEWLNAKQQLAKVEKIFVQRLKGDPNVLRKNIFASKKAQKIKNTFGLSGGLGEPVSAAGLMAAAAPFIAAIAQLLSGLRRPKVEDSPNDIEDPNSLPGMEIPASDMETGATSEVNLNDLLNDTFVDVSNNRGVPNYTPPQPPQSTPPLVYDAERSSDNVYQDNGNTTVSDREVQNKTQTEPETPSTGEKSNTGLLFGLGLGLSALLLAFSGKKKGLSGTDDLGCSACSTPVGNIEPVNTDDVVELSGVKNKRKSISVTI